MGKWVSDLDGFPPVGVFVFVFYDGQVDIDQVIDDKEFKSRFVWESLIKNDESEAAYWICLPPPLDQKFNKIN